MPAVSHSCRRLRHCIFRSNDASTLRTAGIDVAAVVLAGAPCYVCHPEPSRPLLANGGEGPASCFRTRLDEADGPTLSLGMALAGNSLCPWQEERTMRGTRFQIGNSG